MMESFLWAAKETLRRKGRQIEGTEHTPQKPELWMFMYRGAVALVAALFAWLVLWLLPSVYGAATVATIVVLAVWYLAGLAASGAEYDLAKFLVKPTDNAEYDGNRSFAVYLVLLVVRPLCVWLLCFHFNFTWLLTAMLLAACSVQGLLAGSIALPKLRLQWILAIAFSIIACGVSAHWTIRPGWFLLLLLATLVAAILPQIIAARVPTDVLHAPQQRKTVYFFFETVLLLLGLLEMVA